MAYRAARLQTLTFFCFSLDVRRECASLPCELLRECGAVALVVSSNERGGTLLRPLDLPEDDLEMAMGSSFSSSAGGELGGLSGDAFCGVEMGNCGGDEPVRVCSWLSSPGVAGGAVAGDESRTGRWER